MTATTQAEKKHFPNCAINRPPTPSGCRWVCDCEFKRMRIFKVDDEISDQAELRTLAYAMESMSHVERMEAIKAHTNKHLLDLIGPNEPVDGFSKDPNRSIRPAARNEVRDELRAKIEAWAGGEA